MTESDPKKRSNLNWLGVIIMVIAVGATTIGTPLDDNQSCEENLKNIATALEIYSIDHTGRYPAEFNALIPDYLPELPLCSEPGDYSLQTGLAPGNDLGFQDYYLIVCHSGKHSKPLGYNSIKGPVDPEGLKSSRPTQ